MIKAILAVDSGNAIGWSDGRLPWKIPYDMKRFKELTTGNIVVMGFNTFKSLNRPNGLPDRQNVVLTRKDYSTVREHIGLDVSVIGSLDYIKRKSTDLRDTFIIGGASVYTQALDAKMIDELHVTFVHANSGADVTLPFELTAWKLFILHQQKLGVNWEIVDHLRPTVVAPSPGIDIMVFRKR